jgi:flagellar biosynthetic protein FliR
MSLDLATMLQGQVYAYLLIFCRIGAIFMAMPSIGETYVPQHIRLQFALMVSFILLPFLAPIFPSMPESPGKVAEMIATEFITGAFIGLCMRLILSTLEIAGMLISMQIGLSNAMIFNPAMASQGSLTGALMSLLGVVILMESGLFEMMMAALGRSYVVFKAGGVFPIGDMTEFISRTITGSLDLALRLVAPFMILGILFQLVAGVMVKMVPQMQIFFVAAPLQILLGLTMFALTIGGIMTFWAHGYEANLIRMLG